MNSIDVLKFAEIYIIDRIFKIWEDRLVYVCNFAIQDLNLENENTEYLISQNVISSWVRNGLPFPDLTKVH